MNIHPTAVIAPSAQIAPEVTIGPFCVIESGVVIETGCELSARVSVKTGVQLGPHCKVGENTVLGGLGQHVCPPCPPGGVKIGANNTFRENCTVHRSIRTDGFTIIGSNNFFMAGAHIAHDCVIEDNNIMANNVLLGGHVEVGHRAFISGAVAVHQFCRVGSYAMVGGQAHITRDVPPFVTVDGLTSRVVGINRVGIRRSGFTSAQISRLKDAYSVIYRRDYLWKEVLEILERDFNQGEEILLFQALSTTKRGIIPARIQPSLKFRAGENQDNSGDSFEESDSSGNNSAARKPFRSQDSAPGSESDENDNPNRNVA